MQSALFYSQTQQNRNAILRNPQKHKEYAVKWHEITVEAIKKRNKLEMKKYACMQKLDARRCNNWHMRHWNIQTMRIFSKARIEVLNDISQHFRMQSEERVSITQTMQIDTGFNER